MKKNSAFTLLVVACLLLFGSFSISSGQEISDETLIIGLALEPPHLVTPSSQMGGKESMTVQLLMYDNLVIVDENTGELKPGLATDWEWMDDTHFRLTLRDDVYFEDGSKFTAHDVLYVFQVGHEVSPSSFNYFDVDNFVVESDTSIVMATNGIWVQAIDLLAQEDKLIVNKNSLEAAGGTRVDGKFLRGAGTGKYNFVEWVDGRHILLERNNNYWDQEDLAYYKYVKFVFINDHAARAMAAESGDIDIASDLAASQVSALEGHPDLDIKILDTRMAGVIFMNTANGPLQDERVREAIYLLVDNEALNYLVNAGFGTPHETMISPFAPVYDGLADSEREVDREKAKQLLKEAGYEKGFTLTMLTMETTKPSAEVLQENLRFGNINVVIDINETPVHFGHLRDGNYDLHFSQQNYWFYTETLRLVDGRYTTADVYGGANYEDANFSPLLDAGYEAFDMEERKQAYAAIQDYVKQHRVCFGTNTVIRVEALRKGIEGIGATPRGWANYRNVREIAQ